MGAGGGFSREKSLKVRVLLMVETQTLHAGEAGEAVMIEKLGWRYLGIDYLCYF